MIDFKITEYYEKYLFNDVNFGFFMFKVFFSVLFPFFSMVYFFYEKHLNIFGYILLAIIFFVLMEISTIDFAYNEEEIIDGKDSIMFKFLGLLSAGHLIGTYIFGPIMLYNLCKGIFSFITIEIICKLGIIIIVLFAIYLFFKVNYVVISYVREEKDERIKMKKERIIMKNLKKTLKSK